MIRVDSGSLIGAPIDWNKNGTTDGSVAQDLDFNGKANEAAFSDYNDWGNIDLRQVGGRRNITRYSLAVGRDDLSTGDFGLGDFGLGDFGLGDFGLGDFGLGDFGLGDFGLGDFGLGDFGLGAALDFETATALGNAPNSLTVTVSQQAITINWNPPNLAAVTNYAVYRAVGTITATNLPVFQANVTPPATTYIDNNVKNNVTYTYLVVATFQTNPGEPTKQSGPSNQVTVKK